MLHGDVRALHLPFVVNGGNAVYGGLVAFGCRVVQRGDQAVGYGGVVVDQLGQGGETALRRDVHLRMEGDGARRERNTD